MGMGAERTKKMPGAHKIGAAISGKGIAGGNFMDITLFLKLRLFLWRCLVRPTVT